MKQHLIKLLALTALLAAGAGGRTATLQPVGEDAVIYHLPHAGFVTLVIEDAQSNRVRNLVAGAWREAGQQTEPWDGLGDAGEPTNPGLYHWRGIIHGPITSLFQGAFNSPGNPPWLTMQQPAQYYIRASGSGGWLSDHERPLCACSTGDRIYLGAAIAEAGHSIIEVDPDGNKRWGTLWMGLSGASAIAVESNLLYMAGEKGWLQDRLTVNRLDRHTHLRIPNPPLPQKQRTTEGFLEEKSADFSAIRGLAITPQFIVLSLADRGRLACFDKQSAVHIRDVPLPDAGGLCQLSDGGLLAISSNQVVKVDLEQGRHQPVITTNLLLPSGVAVDANGQIFVTDLASAEQCVKVFTATGNFLRRIGKPGGRREGPFDPLTMCHPTAVAIDNRDQVWVTEYDFLPKRISVWSPDGKLVRDYLGPPHYGGGGALDPRQASRAFYKGMEFSWKPWPQRAALQRVLFRPEEHADLPYPSLNDDTIPQFPVYRGDSLYLVHDAGPNLPGVFIGEVTNNRLVPRIIFGTLDSLRKAWARQYPDYIRKFSDRAAKPWQGVFLWCDTNGDGRADPAEVTVQRDWRFTATWAMRTGTNLTLYALTDKAVVALPPHSAAGPLRYDLADARLVPFPETHKVLAAGPDAAGNLIVNTTNNKQGDRHNTLLSLAPDGRVRWTYPNPYPSNTHDSPRPRLGDIQHTLNVEGLARINDQIGDVFQLNGNKGVRYLFTTDGLFVGNLFADMRLAPVQPTVSAASFDMPLEQTSLGDECFFGWFGRADDGRFLQVLGKDASSVFEVRGLETVTRLNGGSLRLTTNAAAQAVQTAAAPVRPVAVNLGGLQIGAVKSSPYSIPSDQPVARFLMSAAPNELLLAVELSGSNSFQNAGDDVNTLFHSGAAIDLRLATDPKLPTGRTQPAPGDQRFVIAMLQGKPVVVRYEYAVSSTKEPAKFASPTGVATVDRITVLKQAHVTVDRNAQRVLVVMHLPWTSLGLAGPPTVSLRGDVGVILSDSTGTRAVARHYYFDHGSQVVSDLPSEVRINPSQWGILQF